jgi:parallel beta-helix repeat protein
VDLWSAKGKPSENIIERTVSFENVDMECHTDGNGFTVDVNTTGATFVNNIGFRNGGSCFRITGSSNTVMINNTCYDNGLDPEASNVPPNNGCNDITIPAPKYPGEFYFNDTTTTLQGARLFNNLAVAGISRKSNVTTLKQLGINRTPTATGSNVSVDEGGTASFFTAPPLDLTLVAASAGNIISKGTPTDAPQLDIGFDPRCIIKQVPKGSGVQPWWQYAIDYDYIRSIGGTAYCFHPKVRSNPPDIGAYNH